MCACQLIDDTQQLPPRELGEPLEAILNAWENGQREEASDLLLHIKSLAEKMGYL